MSSTFNLVFHACAPRRGKMEIPLEESYDRESMVGEAAMVLVQEITVSVLIFF